MKIFTAEQIGELDAYTIKHEPIDSVDLMERAAVQLFNWITDRFERTRRILVFVGPGNNGGDGLALARLLASSRYDVDLYYIAFTEKQSADWEINRLRLEKETDVIINTISSSDHFPLINKESIIVDAIFGSGLSRPAEGLSSDIIKAINQSGCKIISVDVPSGLFCEENLSNHKNSVIRADFTLCFQFPRLAFMFSENAKYTGEWDILPIGLHEAAVNKTNSPFSLISRKEVVLLLKSRSKFDHKGVFGHGLMISGSEGKIGAAVLSARAALKTGIGLLTCHVPIGGTRILQCTVPEAMVISDSDPDHIAQIGSTSIFSAVGVGPGLGTKSVTQKALYELIKECKKPMVIDADAINILSQNKNWISLLQSNTILTPHLKEFERLAGETENGYSRIKTQINYSIETKCIVILKGAHTSISFPDGNIIFNNTGNPGMATAGSGDVLTGIILSLLSQGYETKDAAVLGVYIHGMAGDLALNELGFEALIASDIINNIGSAFKNLRNT